MRVTENDMMLGRDWTGENLAGWWLSEKLDGVRGEWDGARLWTRGGRVLEVPPHLKLPQGVALSGEIYLGRGTFDIVNTAVRLNRLESPVRFVVFDSPGDGTFEERIARAQAVWSDLSPHRKVRSNYEALRELAGVQSGGGEGLVAVRPGSAWAQGRSAHLLKVVNARVGCLAA